MKKTFLLAILFLLLSACSNSSADITGEWKLISYGDVNNPTPALPNIDTSIKFDTNDQIGGSVGCNTFGGNYKTSDSTVAFSGIFSTMMYCDETSLQEQAVLGVFSDGVSLQTQLNGNTLTITSADGSSVVVLERK